MKINAIRQEGYELLHDGSIELAAIEANGIRVDVPRLRRTQLELITLLRTLKAEFQAEDLWKQWQKRYGEKANITSRDQLASILHVDLQLEVKGETESGQPSVDEEALQHHYEAVPALLKIVRYLKYEKALGTFIACIDREIVGDRIHPSFPLHTARSYRGSSQDPNFQNFPVRDKEISRIIRSLFIASPDHVLVENDFKGAEVVVSAAYHKDPNFISYITNPSKDMHRDMAAQIYELKPGQVTKDIRYGAKNKFVFPQFYGDFYVSCARSLWDWIRLGKLKGPDGKSLYEHLKSKGIYELGDCDPERDPVSGTFEKHLQQVERDFWDRRFRAYGAWRKIWYKKYLERGYFDLLTGFRIYGNHSRNQCINTPVQGAAFHCLLWSLIRINRQLRKHRMKSMIVGQIHDSLVGDVAVNELRDYLAIVEEVVTNLLPKAYTWLVVPLQVEYEVAPPGTSWFDKKECKFKAGYFVHPENPKKITADAKQFLALLAQSKKV